MAKKNGMKTVECVWQLVEPIINGLGLVLWDVRYIKEGADWYLRVFIDKDNGVNIEDCENVSRAIDKPLDQLDPIEQGYCLEVCSPGLERELIREEHFTAFIGSDVLVKMIRPIEGMGKEFGGKLTASTKTDFTLQDLDGNTVVIVKKDTAWVKLDDFD